MSDLRSYRNASGQARSKNDRGNRSLDAKGETWRVNSTRPQVSLLSQTDSHEAYLAQPGAVIGAPPNDRMPFETLVGWPPPFRVIELEWGRT